MTDDSDVPPERAFFCAECGEKAGAVRIATSDLGLCVEVSSFTSKLRAPVAHVNRSVPEILAAMESAKTLFALDFEFAPFYCPQCDLVYCGTHWRRWDVFEDDGWHDSIRGVCPRGHERMLED